MKNSRYLAVLMTFSLAALVAVAAAQTATPGLDLGAIRARASEQASDAEALAATARTRAAAVTRDAADTAGAVAAKSRRYTGSTTAAAAPAPAPPFDFDRMIADAGTMAREDLGEAPRFIAFASLAMPPEALRSMIADVGHAGGVVVLRGLPGGSAKALTAALARVATPGEALGGAGIDPRLFRAFGVEVVPTYVVTSSDFDLCDGFDCMGQVPPHDRMSGNVTVRYALETFAAGGGPGARIAARYLDRLEGDRP